MKHLTAQIKDRRTAILKIVAILVVLSYMCVRAVTSRHNHFYLSIHVHISIIMLLVVVETVLFGIHLLLLFLIHRLLDPSYKFDGIKPWRGLRKLGVGVLLGICVYLTRCGLGLIAILCSQKSPITVFAAYFVHNSLLALIACCFVNFMIGLNEELIFRSFLFTRLRAFWGEDVALISVSLVFTVFHQQYGFPGMFIVFPISLLLTVSLMLTDNLWLPIGIHWGLDWLDSILFESWFDKSGHSVLRSVMHAYFPPYHPKLGIYEIPVELTVHSEESFIVYSLYLYFAYFVLIAIPLLALFGSRYYKAMRSSEQDWQLCRKRMRKRAYLIYVVCMALTLLENWDSFSSHWAFMVFCVVGLPISFGIFAFILSRIERRAAGGRKVVEEQTLDAS